MICSDLVMFCSDSVCFELHDLFRSSYCIATILMWFCLVRMWL